MPKPRLLHTHTWAEGLSVALVASKTHNESIAPNESRSRTDLGEAELNIWFEM